MASKNGHTEVVKLLLNKGAKANVKNIHDGVTALMKARQNGYKKIVNLLIENGAKE
jgi:ankyrin repeat protein